MRVMNATDANGERFKATAFYGREARTTQHLCSVHTGGSWVLQARTTAAGAWTATGETFDAVGVVRFPLIIGWEYRWRGGSAGAVIDAEAESTLRIVAA